MSDFIRLNGFDVKDQKARDYIDSFKSLLGYEGEPGNGDKLTVLDNLSYYVEDLKELLGYEEKGPGEDGIFGTEDDSASKIAIVDKIQEKVDNIAEELGYKIEEGKVILDRLTELEKTVTENSGNTEEQFKDVQDQIEAIHKHGNLLSLDKISDSLIDSWTNKSDFSGSYNDLTDKPQGMASEDFVVGLVPTLVSQLENDVPYFHEEDIIEQEIMDALIATFDNLVGVPGEGETPASEPPPPGVDPEKPFEPDFPYVPEIEYEDTSLYGKNLIRNGKFKDASGTNIVPHWTIEGNIEIDSPAYQEVSEYFTILLLDKTQSFIRQSISDLERNTAYTLSYDIAWESAVSDYSIIIGYYSSSSEQVYIDEFYETCMDHKTHVITTPDMDFDHILLSIVINGLAEFSSSEANVYLGNFKLEEGFDETKWTEHPDLV